MRWYDQSLGRFIQPDTLVPNPGDPVAFDRYHYSRNSPLVYVDPSGHAAYCGDDYDPGCMDQNEHITYYNMLFGSVESISLENTLQNEPTVDNDTNQAPPELTYQTKPQICTIEEANSRYFDSLIDVYQWLLSTGIDLAESDIYTIYRLLKGGVPLNVGEGVIAGSAQYLKDIDNSNISGMGRLGRALLIGFETLMTDIVSSGVGISVAVMTLPTGPETAIVSYFTTSLIVNVYIEFWLIPTTNKKLFDF